MREPAVELVVNPNTVVRAYNELEHEGLLRIERGKEPRGGRRAVNARYRTFPPV